MTKGRKKAVTVVISLVAAVTLIFCLKSFLLPAPQLLMVDTESGEVYFKTPLDNELNFSVSYTHSVNKSDVEEYYRWDDDHWSLYKTRYMGFGAGVATELRKGETLRYDEDGYMIIENMNVPVETLSYRVGIFSDQILHIKEQQWYLKDLAPPFGSVVFRLER